MTSAANDALEEQWRRAGYLHLRSIFTPEQLETARRSVAALWETRPRWVTVDDLETGRRCRLSDRNVGQLSRLKLNDLYLGAEPIRDLLLAPQVLDVVKRLLGEPPVLCNSLNLERSSEQDNHVDALYMTPRTPGKLVALWIALEDVHENAGPLRLYPGSHLIPPYQFRSGARHAVAGEMELWAGWIHEQVRERAITPVSVLPRAGDVILWHGDLLHGADVIRDATMTRNSIVAHYFAWSDCFEAGQRIREHGTGSYIARRPQPTGTFSRALSAIERRVQKVRARLRSMKRS